MRIVFLSLLLFFTACAEKKDEEKKVQKNENTDYLVTLDGIGAVKTGLSQGDLEKLLGQKVYLSNPTDTISGSWSDSAVVKYKDAELRLGFVRSYVSEDSFYMRLDGIATSSPLAKTAMGIGIGSGKKQVIDAFFDDHTFFMWPEYADTTYTTLSKNLYTISVREAREGREIVFRLKDNKVYAIAVGAFYDDQE